ncbi:MAG TPA: hypothetical protein VFL80_00280 [Thermoanaerobaculia bacterium]|nr:hypothetical protein [Thermoanaerobaculia bacterium]
MADVQIQQTPSRSNWPWAIVIIVLVLVIGWFALGRPYLFEEKTEVNIGTTATSGT